MTLKAVPPFDHVHPKIIELTFSFTDFVSASKKYRSLCQFILQPILEFYCQSGKTHIGPFTPKNSSINSQFLWKKYFTIFNIFTCKKLAYFIVFFQRYSCFENHATWLAKSILAHISETKFLPNTELVRGHNKYSYP